MKSIVPMLPGRLRWALPGIAVAGCALAVLAGAALPRVAIADDPGPALEAGERAAIEAVVRGQLAAFARDDALVAFFHASPGIQARFGTPEGFMAMVREAYRPVYRPRAVSFQPAEIVGGVPVQRVLLTGPHGRRWLAVYPMWRDERGVWRIDGCYLLGVDGQST